MLISRTAWTAALLSSLEDGCTPRNEIGASVRGRLVDHPDETFRERARAVFASILSARQDVIARYREAMPVAGQAEAGAIVFRRACATCHRLGSEGFAVGPDLASLNDRSSETLLTAILDPNRAVEAKFVNYTLATKDGRVLDGLIASENASGVTLLRAEGKEDVLLRDEIEEMTASGKSLMPEGMENDLSTKDVADLIAYLGGLPASPATTNPEP
jgi:putative heme-binding domain-containing protein